MANIATEKKKNLWGRLLAEHRSPQAIAAGVSFGLMLGLVPKDSLLALALLLAISVLPLHQMVACIVAATVTLLSPWTQVLTHPIGDHFLHWPLVGSGIGRLYEIPLFPWMRLENSLVTGAILVGFAAWIPCYFLSQWCARQSLAMQFEGELVQLAASRLRQPRKTASKVTHSTSNASTEPTLDNQPNSLDVQTAHGEADNQVAEEDLDESRLLAETHELKETLIEVVRFKHSQPDLCDTKHSPPAADSSQQAKRHSEVSDPISGTVPKMIPNDSSYDTAVTENLSAPRAVGTESSLQQSDPNVRQFFTHSGTKEESLRHILRHIHGLRESRKEPEKTV